MLLLGQLRQAGDLHRGAAVPLQSGRQLQLRMQRPAETVRARVPRRAVDLGYRSAEPRRRGGVVHPDPGVTWDSESWTARPADAPHCAARTCTAHARTSLRLLCWHQLQLQRHRFGPSRAIGSSVHGDRERARPRGVRGRETLHRDAERQTPHHKGALRQNSYWPAPGGASIHARPGKGRGVCYGYLESDIIIRHLEQLSADTYK